MVLRSRTFRDCRVQNTLARVVAGTKRREQIRPVMRDLHWLPVQQRIEYKVALITYKVLNTDQPEFLRSLIQEYKPARRLRSEGQGLLVKPSCFKSTLGERAYTQASATVWNSLPEQLRKVQDLLCFKKILKTFFSAVWIVCSAATSYGAYDFL